MPDPANTTRNHIETFKSLQGRSKWEFVWEYYKIQIIVIIFAALALAYILSNAAPKTRFTVAYYGRTLDHEVHGIIRNDINERFPDEEGLGLIEILSFNVYSSDANYTRSQTEGFLAKLRLGEIDVIMTDSALIEGMIDKNFLKKCGEYLPMGLMDRYYDSLYESGSFYGIVVSPDNRYFRGLDLESDDLIIAVPMTANAENAELILKIIQTFMGD